MSTRLKYDGLPEGTHTFVYLEDPARPDAAGDYTIIGYENQGRRDRPAVYPGDVVEVQDLDDPHSERARLCRDHLARGIAHVVKEEKPKKAAASAPPGKS